MLAAVIAWSSAAATENADGFAPLEGEWHCEGHFVSNGKHLSSDVEFKQDANSGALIVRHDDRPPGQYHSLELWTARPAQRPIRAAIADGFTGMRWFESPGWSGGTLVWTRTEDGTAIEQFAYRLLGPGSLAIDWSRKVGGTMALGDTVSCAKRGQARSDRARGPSPSPPGAMRWRPSSKWAFSPARG